VTSAYITPEGRSGLEAELSSLWERRARTVTALAAAAAEGDRSENAEYIYRRKELREIDRRVGYLQRRLPALRVVDQVRSHDRVYFGAWVTLEDESGASRTWRIVGPDEFDRDPSYISVDAPLARGMMGREVGAEFALNVRGHMTRYRISGIRYR
jgi:transcription elongation factor GreB